MEMRESIIQKIFALQNENRCWKMLPPSHTYYPDYLHYAPNFKSTLWTLVLLADLGLDRNDGRVRKPMSVIQEHFYDTEHRIYCLKKEHFPIPCLNGNMIYLDSYFNHDVGEKSSNAIDFFHAYQRFDDGNYAVEKNDYCANKSCYGGHTCYWGITKILKGLSFIPMKKRNARVKRLLEKCIDFVLLHHVCYSSRNTEKPLTKRIDKLTFPNMYDSDMLEILWVLKREKIQSVAVERALSLLNQKRLPDGRWNLERKIHNLTVGVGEINSPNRFVTERATEVLDYYRK